VLHVSFPLQKNQKWKLKLSMARNLQSANTSSCCSRLFFFVLFFFCMAVCEAAPPGNDDCPSASIITIPNGGFGLGTFTSIQTDLTAATVQTGETFSPAIFVAGLDKKSVWFRFSISTIRAVRVTLTQPGTVITAGDAGFAVYQTSNCLPTNADISSKLTPIVTFGNTYHPCVPTGDYLIQVSSNFNANGPITVQIEISDQTGAAYDHPDQAYAFGTVGYYAHKIDFNTECQSIEDATEICNAFSNPLEYNKSAWLTFKTPSYFDYIVLQLSGTGASSYFPSNNGLDIKRKFGFTLYRGDAVTTPIPSLVTISGCDSLETNGYYAAYKMYKCSDLDTGTTYSIQFFIKKDFADDVRWGILVGGQSPTKAPKPILSQVPSPANALGNLAASPAGIVTSVNDVWGCNSRHNTSVCNPSLPDTGIVYNGGKYNLSSFFTFTLASTCAITFNGYVTQCGPQPLIRVFKQGLTNSCNGLDTSNIIGTFIQNQTIDCLPLGDYTVQVSGQEYQYPFNYFTYSTPTYNAEQCLSSNLGTSFRLDMTANIRKAANKYSLNATGAFDSINVVGSSMQPLTAGVSYSAVMDTMGCQNTLRPIDTTCGPLNNKLMYREFVVNDSGIVDFSSLTYSPNPQWKYRLYSGDANALATAQNVFSFPDKVSGMVPKTECFDYYTSCANKTACVIPGTYTFTTMGGDADVGRVDKPVFTFVRTRTKHNSPFAAQDLGSLWDTLGVGGGTKTTDLDTWSCDDNAVDINGYAPCTVGGSPAKKAIYRQFYLNKSSLVKFDVPYYYYCANRAYGYKTLFYGKATDGLGGLTPVGNGWNCWQYAAGTTAGCDLLPAGWYTVVSYNQGPSYDNTIRNTNLEGRYNSAVSYYDEFTITITPSCPGPKYNRPYKASVDAGNQPHLIQFVNRVNSTPAYPRTDTTYVLPTERFNCTLDTPFANHPIKSCEAASNRVAYYVFKTTQQCFLQINAGGYFATLYDKDVRADSLQFGTLTPIQSCSNAAGYIQYCFFQPGTYTLVVFAKDANICQSVSPSIYIDRIGYSRFDYAKNAYDFGAVPPDSAWHFGKVGDVNPLNSSRAPSNDIFYCTTGAFSTDPTEPVCGSIAVNPNVYNSGPNKPVYDSAFAQGYVSRRNLWYTFVINQPGTVTVKVESKTPGREYQQKFSVYRSNVDASLPFSTVVSNGLVDSTAALGLTHIATNVQNWYYCANIYNNVQFYRDPCSSIPTRYYVLVENVFAEPYENGGTLPNTQAEVSVMIDSINLVLPKHDHYSQAGNIGTVGVGTFQGDIDNYSCATKDATDPFYYYGNDGRCQKTLWYKFTPTITGNVRYRIYVGGVRKQDYYDVQLFRQIIPGDSTINGLQIQGYRGAYSADNTYWAETCVSPGTYYLMITGCDQVNAYVYPEIQLLEAVGDFCSRAVPAAIIGPGSVTASVLVDCHTIGTDYGEFGPQLTCPQGANTADYKSSWFRMDIGGTDTLDVTTFLVENTNAASSDIKYRLMTGDCGAMQEQSCVLDALTQNTYQCLVPGQSYYVQVFTPITKFNQQVTGTIDLKLSAIAHADTCAPLTNCLASANFTPLFDCTKDDSVKFVNFSTYGTSIQYKWFFGYNNQTSTAVSPYFFYPALPNDSTYSIKLVVENINCGKKDSVTKTFTVPGRPFIDFGNDIASCNGSPVTLVATSHAGAVYLWNDNSSNDSLTVSTAGSNNYWVKIDYNGCSSRDTVKVVVSNIAARPLQNIILCADSVSISASRGQGETYKWNTGATTASIFASNPGVYWADVKYFTCTYRDSFVVNNVNTARPLGRDTTVCITANGYVLRATTAGAQSYLWNNGTVADTLKITAPGQYDVSINFGSCIVKDTVVIGGYPAAIIRNTDTSFCAGSTLRLPWGALINSAGIYRDTLRYGGGCDSLVWKVTVTINPKPNLGRDTTVCLALNPFVLNATAAGAVSYQWQNGPGSATFNVAAPGLYWVQVIFATCSTRDSILISGSAAPVTNVIDTSTCAGSPFSLPWGTIVNSAGSYRDSIASYLGCDSIITVVNLTLKIKPSLGRDTAVSICSGSTYNFAALYNVTGLTPDWRLNSIAVLNPSAVAAAGVYRLIAINNSACSDTALVALTVNPKPSLGNDTAIGICSGNTFNLTSLYSTTGLTSNWTFNNTVVTNPSAVSKNGNYQLIVTNTNGCRDTAIAALTVNPKPVIGNDTSIAICQGRILNLTNIYTTTGLAVSWTKNNVIISNPAAVSVAGIYRLIAATTPGCTDTAAVTLTVNPKPVLGNDTTINICQGNSFNLNRVYNTGSNINTWTNAGVAVPNPASVNAAGIYQLITTNISGCADTALLTLDVKTNPTLIINNPPTICVPLTTDLTAAAVTAGSTAGLAFTYWQDAAATNAYNTAAAATAGTYYIKGTNAAGCFDIKTVTVTNYPLPVVDAGKDVVVCDKESTTLNATVSSITAPVSYQWEPADKGGIANPKSATTVVKPAATQQYILTMTDGYGCSYAVNDTVMVIMQPPVAASAGRDTIAVIDYPVRLQASGGVRYLWSPPFLLDNPSVYNPQATISSDTEFIVEVKDNAGCVGYDTVKVVALAGISIYVPNAFSPNGDGINETFKPVASGIQSLDYFRIMNRYGEIVFETSQLGKGWNGMFKGKPQSVGNYVWLLKAKNIFGKMIERKGNVLLLR
jgi:gliding motility-associated-like protein